MATAAEQVAAQMARSLRVDARLEWAAKKVEEGVITGMNQRVRIPGRLIRDKVVANLSKPVVKRKSSRTGRIVVDPKSRSQPGEFPRADTTRLMKDIFVKFVNERRTFSAFIGTTLDYGLFHEVNERSFLVRTLNDHRNVLRRILVGSNARGIAVFSQTR